MGVWITVCCIMLGTVALGGDISNWYYASAFAGEPRFSEPWLAEGYVRLTGGTSEMSFDRRGAPQPLFDIFGQNIPQTWAQEMPDLDPAQRTIDATIATLSDPLTPSLTASGEFQLIQFDMQYTQNLDYGWFARFHLPIRDFEFTKLKVHTDPVEPQKNAQLLNDNLDAILERMGYDQLTKNTTDIGDISLLLGYTLNYEDTNAIDFIDTTIACGVLTPSGRMPDPHTVFDLPHGFHERTGWIIHYTGAYGIYDWLTFGWHARAIIFARSQMHIRAHTIPEGQGWIAPQIVNAHVSDGHLWHVGMYTKADHALQGLSLLLGYSFQRKEPSEAHPCNQDARDEVRIAQDRRFQGWEQHTFHWNIAYDFATYARPYAPEISVFSDHIINGNQVFESSTGGFSIGCNILFTY